ncbi:MAG: hypothetical protein QY326_00015 [Bdellovibrionota bacterium]|nr:MAG: hypothetical protein QY326_00015 [Bdellovibrionota bacterium]
MPDPLLAAPLSPLSLPHAVEDELCGLAASSDALILGEIHGTREVPRLVLGLLDRLQQHGYGILALEVPHSQEAMLLKWTRGEESMPPPFFSNPSGDGRGNLEVLSLAREAARPG